MEVWVSEHFCTVSQTCFERPICSACHRAYQNNERFQLDIRALPNDIRSFVLICVCILLYWTEIRQSKWQTAEIAFVAPHKERMFGKWNFGEMQTSMLLLEEKALLYHHCFEPASTHYVHWSKLATSIGLSGAVCFSKIHSSVTMWRSNTQNSKNQLWVQLTESCILEIYSHTSLAQSVYTSKSEFVYRLSSWYSWSQPPRKQ